MPKFILAETGTDKKIILILCELPLFFLEQEGKNILFKEHGQ